MTPSHGGGEATGIARSTATPRAWRSSSTVSSHSVHRNDPGSGSRHAQEKTPTVTDPTWARPSAQGPRRSPRAAILRGCNPHRRASNTSTVGLSFSCVLLHSAPPCACPARSDGRSPRPSPRRAAASTSPGPCNRLPRSARARATLSAGRRRSLLALHPLRGAPWSPRVPRLRESKGSPPSTTPARHRVQFPAPNFVDRDDVRSIKLARHRPPPAACRWCAPGSRAGPARADRGGRLGRSAGRLGEATRLDTAFDTALLLDGESPARPGDRVDLICVDRVPHLSVIGSIHRGIHGCGNTLLLPAFVQLRIALTEGNAELFGDEIDSGDRLGDGVFDLESGVDLEGHRGVGGEEELDGARTSIVHLGADELAERCRRSR